MQQSELSQRKPTLSGVNDAARCIAAVVPSTPLLPVEIDGVTIFAKAESLQPIGAFKLRGAWWRLSNLSAQERARGVVAFSSGNHAQGVAWAARRLGMQATIVMPRDAPVAKRNNTRALGADVVLYDRATEDRGAIAGAIAGRTGATIVPPFDDPHVIEGQGSAGIEAIAQLAAMGRPAPDLVIACCGGGGLASGLALACAGARMVIVEPEGWDDMTRSLAAGELMAVGPNPPVTACDALQTPMPSPLTFAVLQARDATGVTVTESEVEDAMRFAFAKLRLVVEPGGAVALAAVLAGKVELGATTLITLSGGNVDPAQFAAVLGR